MKKIMSLIALLSLVALASCGQKAVDTVENTTGEAVDTVEQVANDAAEMVDDAVVAPTEEVMADEPAMEDDAMMEKEVMADEPAMEDDAMMEDKAMDEAAQ